MAYDDDDDLFDHDFDFVDDDDEADEADEEDSDVEETPKPKPKPRKQPAGRAKSAKEKEPAKGRSKAAKGKDPAKEKSVEKPGDDNGGAARAANKPKPGAKRGSRRSESEDAAESAASSPAPPPPPPLEPAPVGYILGEDPLEDDELPEAEAAPAAAEGPQADHLVHIYEHGALKRTIARKFTDEEAVSFAEEYTRTNKAYGRYAVAMPEDEEPSPTFAGAARG